MLIEKARRLAHGYRNFQNYRLRMLLAASGTRTRRAKITMPRPRSSPKSPFRLAQRGQRKYSSSSMLVIREVRFPMNRCSRR